MALSSLTLNAQFSWVFTRLPAGFKNAQQGPQSKAFNWTPTVPGAVNQAYIGTVTLAAAATTTIDLQSFTNLIFEAPTLDKVNCLFVVVKATTAGQTGGRLTIEPGAVNPLVWFWGAGQLSLNSAGCLAHKDDTPTTVDATHRTLKLTNQGTQSIDIFIAIAGLDV